MDCNNIHTVLNGVRNLHEKNFQIASSVCLSGVEPCACVSQRHRSGHCFWQSSHCNCSCDWSLKVALSKLSGIC